MKLPQMIIGIVLLLVVVSGCSAATVNTTINTLNPEVAAILNSAPASVKEAYAYAIANPHELEKYPCYCGCNNMGHTSNRSCYIKEISTDGKMTFDYHALGCRMCVDITNDVMRLKAEGKSSRDIRTYIDAQYSPLGPATNTEFPTD
jgi:hypothetical protein